MKECESCGDKTDFGAKCRKCCRLCKNCKESIDYHSEGKLHKCLLELSK